MKSKEQCKISEDLLEELHAQLLIMQKLVENAIYKQTDLMLLRIEYQNYENEYSFLKNQNVTDLYDLNLLCGIGDTSIVELQSINFQLKPDQLSNSQFLVSYKLDSLNNLAEQSIYEQRYKPQLNLFANAGLNAVYLPSFDRFGLSTGLSFSWNIFDGHQRKTQREKLNLNLQILEFEKRYFITQSDINKSKILLQIKSLNHRIAKSEIQINDYNKLLSVYYQELSQGEISVMDLKNLLKDISAKMQESVLMKMEEKVLISSYNYWNY